MSGVASCCSVSLAQQAIGDDRLERDVGGLGALEEGRRDLRLGLESEVLIAAGQVAFRRVGATCIIHGGFNKLPLGYAAKMALTTRA